MTDVKMVTSDKMLSVMLQEVMSIEKPPEIAALCTGYVDAVEMFKENGYCLNTLPTDVQGLLREQAIHISELDLRGSQVTWDHLYEIGKLFPQLRTLDLRDCLQLNPKQWDNGVPENCATNQEIMRSFSCYQDLEIRLTDNVNVVSRHDPVARTGANENMQYITHIMHSPDTTGSTFVKRPFVPSSEEFQRYKLKERQERFERTSKFAPSWGSWLLSWIGIRV